MRTSVAEFLKNFARYQDAVLTEPITVTRNGRICAVLLSPEEYRRLKRLDKRTAGGDEITQDDIAAMERGKPRALPGRSGHDIPYSPLGLLEHRPGKR